MRKTIIIILTLLAASGSSIGTYLWQSQRVGSLQNQHAALERNVSDLQKQYALAMSAAEVSTAGWKKFCDQFLPFCFQYPSEWALTESPLKFTDDNREYASITNPAKTAQISYANPLVKDGGSLSVRIVKVNQITVGNTKVSVIGIIPVSSGVYQPSYIILGGDQALAITPSDKAIILNGSINARFEIGKHDAIFFSGGSTKKITSYDQAKAWFNSIDGKTVAKILESFSVQ